MIFKSQKQTDQELPQTEREAIVDLLHLCIYADAHISLKESAVIEDVIQIIGWDKNMSFSVYESRSVASARAARNEPDSKREFIEYAASRLQSPESKALASSLCADILNSDGTTEKEAQLLSLITSYLK